MTTPAWKRGWEVEYTQRMVIADLEALVEAQGELQDNLRSGAVSPHPLAGDPGQLSLGTLQAVTSRAVFVRRYGEVVGPALMIRYGAYFHAIEENRGRLRRVGMFTDRLDYAVLGFLTDLTPPLVSAQGVQAFLNRALRNWCMKLEKRQRKQKGKRINGHR